MFAKELKFVISAPSNGPSYWPLIQKAAIEAEELGFWALVLPDHYMGGVNFGGDSTMDTWIALSYLATLSDRLRLGSLVTPIGLRPPGVLAKTVSTLDLLTEGRALLGVGAGSSQTEFEAYSQWDQPTVRAEKTSEGVELILRLWTEREVNFQGKFYRAKGAVLEPKPHQRPHPPLFFGGRGRRMLEIAGRYSDICLVPLAEPDHREARRIVLKEARLHNREDKISFAGAAEALPEPWHDYDEKEYLAKVEKAKQVGCEFLVVPFRAAKYMESMSDFARNIIPSL